MLFADHALCCRIEAAECLLTTEVATAIAARGGNVFVAPLAGGAAVHVGFDAPFNKAIGLGLSGPLDEAALTALHAIEQEFDARKAPLQVEITTLADHSIAQLLTRRGYALASFENVLGLRLDAAFVAQLGAKQPPAALRISSCGQPQGEEWMETVVSGFEHPDAVPGGASHESFPREALKQAMRDMAQASGFTRYLASYDDVVVGGGAVRLCRGIAQLCGSATLPAMRRRGVQSALLVHRLLAAARAGCDVAVITTQPGSRSQENAQRQGFALLYGREILVREPGSAAG